MTTHISQDMIAPGAIAALMDASNTVPTSGGTYASNNQTAAAGGSSAHNNMQPFLAANLFIFTGV